MLYFLFIFLCIAHLGAVNKQDLFIQEVFSKSEKQGFFCQIGHFNENMTSSYLEKELGWKALYIESFARSKKSVKNLLKENNLQQIDFLRIHAKEAPYLLNQLEGIQVNVLTIASAENEADLIQKLREKGYKLVSKFESDLTFAHPDFFKVIEPLEFLTPNRFDLMAKFAYVQSIDLELQTEWARKMYEAEIRCNSNFTSEKPSAEKNSYYYFSFPYCEKTKKEDWFEHFNGLIYSIKTVGFKAEKSVIPYQENQLLDGAHRVASALYFNTPILGQKAQGTIENVSSSYLLEKGMERKYLDAMAYEYAKLKKNTRIVCLFPSSGIQKEDIAECISPYAQIVYQKEVSLSEKGKANFLEDFFPKKKVKEIFSGEKPLLVCLVEMKDPQKTIEQKAFYTSSSSEETILLAQTLFNANSLHFLNVRTPKEFKMFTALFEEYKKLIKEAELNPEYLCLDGSAVLAAFGCRDCRDFDILHFGKFPKGHPLIASHNNELKFHGFTKDDIVFNPEHHFYHKGVKFASLEVVQEMKTRRNEKKDRKDLKIIEGKLRSL